MYITSPLIILFALKLYITLGRIDSFKILSLPIHIYGLSTFKVFLKNKYLKKVIQFQP